MSGPTRVAVRSAAPVQVTTPTPKTEPKKGLTKANTGDVSSFGRAVKKPVSLSGAFKALNRAAGELVKPGGVELALEVAGKMLVASAAASASKDVKVQEAFKKVVAQPGAQTFLAEAKKLKPSGQLELLRALPYEARVKIEGELAKLTPSQRSPQLVWLGDKDLRGLGKDGYIAVTAAPSERVSVDGVRLHYPEKIDLGTGKTITTRRDGAYGVIIKSGGKELRAEWKGNGWEYRAPDKAGTNHNISDGKGGFWKPLHAANHEQWTMIKAFEAGTLVARGVTGELDPQTLELFRDQAITANIPVMRERYDELEKNNVSAAQWAQRAANDLTEVQAKVAGAGKYLSVTSRDDGSLDVELVRPPGMSNGEWSKITGKFGYSVTLYERKLNEQRNDTIAQLQRRESAASKLTGTFFSEPYQRFLGGLPPEQRLAEVTRLSQAVKGTAAGQRLAEELLSPRALAAGGNGELVPQTPFAKLVLQNARDTEAGREELKNLVLSLGPQLPGPGADSLGRMFEVLRGRELSPAERTAVQALHHVQSPQEFETLTNPPPGSKPFVVEQAGNLASLLSELGEAPSEKKLNVTGPGIEPAGRALNRGAHYVAMYQAFNSTKDLLQKGVSPETAVNFAEDAARVLGTWGSILETSGKLGKVAKFAGPASDAIGLFKDLHTWHKASTSEGSYRAGVHAGAGALILAGGLAGGPVGVAGVLVGLGVKMFFSRTSEAYEDMHGRLKKTFPHAL